MRTPRALTAGLLLLGVSHAAPALAVDGPARAFSLGEPIAEPKAAMEIQACSGAAESAPFQEKIRKVALDFGLSEEETSKTVRLYVQRCSGSMTTTRGSTKEGGKAFDPARNKKSVERANKTAELLNERRGVEDLSEGVNTDRTARANGSFDYRALNARPGVQPYAMDRHASPVPGIELHSLGDSEVAPAPTMFARAKSLATPSAATVAEDLRTLRAKLADFEIPQETVGLASSNAPLASFVQWAKTAREADLPEITYGIVKEGEVADYSPGLALSRGKITMNHYIRDMPPDERSAVLFHELYHHWDTKIERLNYSNVSYNFIDPAHMPEHEYDAYYMTALYWQKIRNGESKTALARCLDRYPTNPDEVRATVDGIVGRKK